MPCKKGNTPWNKGKKGIYSEDHRRKLSDALIGKPGRNTGHRHSEATRRKIGESSKGRKFSEETRKLWSRQRLGNQRTLGYHHTEAAKAKISAANVGNKKTLGYKHSAAFRAKARQNTLKRLTDLGLSPFTNMGRNERSLLDDQEKVDDVRILRQYPIQKLGYVVDGYCPETNTVYEIYESHHDRRVQKDLSRETEICNALSCDFVIIWDRN